MKFNSRLVPIFLIIALIATTLSCSVDLFGTEQDQEEGPPPQEPMPEEPREEPPPEEPQQQPPPEEPQPQPPQGQQQPQQQPTQQQQQQPPAGGFSADLAVTDIYPGNQPYGMFQMHITNNGPSTVNAIQVNVTCNSEKTDRNTGKVSNAGSANFNVILSLAPGVTFTSPTSLTLDMNVFTYLVTCEVHPPFNDPNPGNNKYSEVFK